MLRGRETGVDALSVSRERKREKECFVEVSSPWIVPAIIYFLSDRGDRLYGGCSVQAPGSSGLPGSAYVLPRIDVRPCSGVQGCSKISITELIPGTKMSMSKVLRFEVSIFRRLTFSLSFSLSIYPSVSLSLYLSISLSFLVLSLSNSFSHVDVL